jgi:hypothetical protein
MANIPEFNLLLISLNFGLQEKPTNKMNLLHTLNFKNVGINNESSVTNITSNFAYVKCIRRSLPAILVSYSACGPWDATNNKIIY